MRWRFQVGGISCKFTSHDCSRIFYFKIIKGLDNWTCTKSFYYVAHKFVTTTKPILYILFNTLKIDKFSEIKKLNISFSFKLKKIYIASVLWKFFFLKVMCQTYELRWILKMWKKMWTTTLTDKRKKNWHRRRFLWLRISIL